MDIWINIGNSMLNGINPYSLSSNGLVYPPLWAIFCTISQYTYEVTSNVFFQYFIVKIPIIVADISIAILIKKIVFNITKNEKKALAAMILYLFNPVTIIISSWWGMFDAIPTLFALLATHFILMGDFKKSGLLLGIGIGFKGIFPAIILPFFMYYIWKTQKMVQSLKYLVYAILIPLLISVPFIIIDTNAYIIANLFHFNNLPKNMTFWFSITNIIEKFNISTSSLTTIISFISVTAFLTLYFLIIKKRNSLAKYENKQEYIIKGVNSVFLIFFVTSTTINEQYLVWILPFLVIYLICFDSSMKKIFYIFTVLDILFIFLNIGPLFFNPITEIVLVWKNFQYSSPLILIMSLIGILFSSASILGLKKINKKKRYLT